MVRRFLFIASFLLWPSLPISADVANINQFSGLNSDDSSLLLQEGQTPDSENVATDLGPGVQGRQGFVIFSTETTSGYSGMWEFAKSDGTRYLITRSGTKLKATTTSGSGRFTIVISTIPTDRIVACSPLGDKFFFADTTNGLKYWNGTSVTLASATLTVDKLVTFKGRLAAAGKNNSPRTIYLSKYVDGTSWTTPVSASDDDPAQIIVAGALNENIQALYAAFQDKLIYFLPNSFGGLYGSRRSNFALRVYSDRVGVSSVETIQDCDGKLRWLGANRMVWEFDGAQFYKISENIDNILEDVDQGDTASRSLLQTTAADFAGGSQSPTGFASTTDVAGSLTPKTTTFLDTTQADFASGTSSTGSWISAGATPNSLQLATATAVASFVDTSSSNFSAGTLTSVSTTQSSGNLQLTLSAESALNSMYSSDVNNDDMCSADIVYGIRSFIASSTYVATSITLRLRHHSAGDGTLTARIFTDSSGSPGTLIGNSPLTLSVDNTVHDVTGSFLSSFNVESGVRYWIVLGGFGFDGCTSASTNGHIYWYYGSTSDAAEKQCVGNGCTPVTPAKYKYKLNGKTYPSSGNIVSRTFDEGFSTNTWRWNWGTFTVNSSIPSGTAITYETQTSSNGTSWSSLNSVTSGVSPTSIVRQYIRYKATLTGNLVATPTLSDVTIANGARIRPLATYTSRRFDTGFSTYRPIWGLVDASSSITNGGQISYFTQSSPDGTTWSTRAAATIGSKIASARNRYLRYQADFSVPAASATARLDDITFTAKSTGVFTSSVFGVGSQITAWGPVNLTLTNGGGSMSIQISTSTDGITFPTWTSFTNNSVPTISTAPYFKARITFDLDVATDTPRIDDITVNWVEGSNLRAASAYYNQRYWLSVAIDASSNNKILVFDKKRQWQRYSGINASALVLFNSSLYFNNSSGIFKGETGYNDNGSSIVSYFKTATLAPSGPDVYSKFQHLYTTTDNSDSTLSTAYQIDGVSTDYNFGSSAMNGTSGIQNIKMPFPITEIQQGRLVNIKWAISGTSFWRIINGGLYFDRDLISY